MTQYVLDNEAQQTEQRFTSLEVCFDPTTIRQLERIGVTRGWRCLEIGGGGGSVARWLADTVGPHGHVVVTDINPRWLDINRPNIEMRRHDIAADELEQEAFDLAHERLVLVHLPERDRALRRMIGALKPGGWLLIESFDCSWVPFVPDCEPAAADLFTKVLDAFHQALARAGVDLAYGRHFHRLLRDAGLVDVQVEAQVQFAPGGSHGCRLHRANVEQLRDRLTDQGLVSEAEIECFYELIEDPAFSVTSYPLVSARGRRPDQRQ
jgi:SAM-dependent methyltransferase